MIRQFFSSGAPWRRINAGRESGATMQSSLFALRTLVMLLSLLAIPLAAVLGTGGLPHMYGMLDQCRVDFVSRWMPAKSGPSPTAASQENLALSGSALSFATPPVEPLAPAAESQPLVASPAVSMAAEPHALAEAHAAPPQPGPLLSTSTPADVLGWIEHRLQTLGAAYYRLETAGVRGEMFRFHCKMTSSTNPNYVRYFEATSSEPQRAMQHVLDQVDAWVHCGAAR
jgi:hypothetical protein